MSAHLGNGNYGSAHAHITNPATMCSSMCHALLSHYTYTYATASVVYLGLTLYKALHPAHLYSHHQNGMAPHIGVERSGPRNDTQTFPHQTTNGLPYCNRLYISVGYLGLTPLNCIKRSNRRLYIRPLHFYESASDQCHCSFPYVLRSDVFRTC